MAHNQWKQRGQNNDQEARLIFGVLLFFQPKEGERLWLVMQAKARHSKEDIWKLYIGQQLKPDQQLNIKAGSNGWQIAKQRTEEFIGLREIGQVHIPDDAWELVFTNDFGREFSLVLFLAEARNHQEALALPE